MLKRLMLMSLLTFGSSCCDVPSTGEVYECEGVFVCYGDHFGLTPAHGCAGSLDEAQKLFYDQALILTQEAKCGDSWEIMTTCKSTGKTCIKEDDNEG